MQTILGANGTIGTLLAKELRAYTDQIRLVSRNPRKVNVTDEILPSDLRDASLVEKAIEGSEIVYLVIGFEYKLKIWQEYWPNLVRAVIDACIKFNSKLVFFDNIYMYDKGEITHMTETSKINPPSKKGKVREEIATLIMDKVKEGKLQALIARAADFYGPGNDKSILIETVYKNLKKGKRSNWLIDANKKHSFTYTPDAAKATAILGNSPDAYNQIWHLPTDKNSLTGKEWVNLFAKEMNVSPKLTVLPLWIIKALGIFMPLMREMPEMMYQYDRDYFFDSSKFEHYFNYTPVKNEDAVRTIVNSI